jgi:integrase
VTCFFICASHTRMIAGELAGLWWGDSDWKGKFLMFRRSVRKGIVNPTKTGKKRRIDMSDDLMEELNAYRRRCHADAMKDGRNKKVKRL